jgi:peptidylprolyl isomerase
LRRFAAWLAVPLMLVATACGNDDASKTDETPSTTGSTKAGTDKISAITVTGDLAAKPEVEFDAPLSFGETQSEIVDEGPGTGDAITASSVVTLDYVAVNARNGNEFDSSWKADGDAPPTSATFTVSEALKGFTTGLVGKHAGDRVLLAVTSKDGFDPNGNGTSVEPGDSLVFVVDIERVITPLAEATGKTQAAPDNVPTLVIEKGQPKSFKKTSTTTAKPTKLGVHPVIVGRGPKVESGQTITVEYVGQIYPDGKVFDESWTRPAPVSFQIATGNVIKGWDQGLVGQPVGSRVILVIPAALGYAKEGSGESIPPNSDLIFSVDVLAAY